jgi:hypothetical protein
VNLLPALAAKSNDDIDGWTLTPASRIDVSLQLAPGDAASVTRVVDASSAAAMVNIPPNQLDAG